MSANLTFVNGFKSWRSFFTMAAVAFSFASVESRADVLLDTFAAGDTAPGLNWSLFDDSLGGGGQSLAVPFATPSAATVNSILAAITATGSVTFGIMADAAGSPSNTFLYSTVLTNPTANVSLSGLGWTLGAGSYWLAAVAAGGTSGEWPGGVVLPMWAYTGGSGSTSWNVTGLYDDAPAARITTAVPEPETYALMLAGLGLMGFMARRKKQSAA